MFYDYPKCKMLYNQIIPMLYDNSLSFNEMIAILRKAVFELAEECKTTEEMVEKLDKKLDEIYSKVDETVSKKVTELITQWKEDGYFNDLLRELLTVPEAQELQYKRYFRTLFETGRNSTFFGSNNEHLENFGDYYALLQGTCFYKDKGGVEKVVGAMIPYGTADTPYYENNARLSVYTRGGTLVKTAVLGLEHANGIAYYDGKFYINGCYYYQNQSADSSTGSGKVFVVSEETLELENTVDFGIVIQNVFVDDNGKLYANLASDNTGFSVIYELNIEDGTATELKTLTPKITHPTQSISYANGKLYVATTDPFNGIGVYDFATGALITRYAIPQYGRDYTFVGEIQGCTFENGKLLFSGSYNLGESSSQVRCNAFYEADPYKGVDRNTTNVRPTNGQAIYVDPDRSGIKNIRNPDGTRERPFKMLGEAAVFVNAHPSHDFTINLMENTEYMAQFRTSKSVTIRTPGVSGGDRSQAHWTGNLLLDGGGSYTLSYLKIGQTIPNLNTDGYCVSVSNSKCVVQAVDFHAESSNTQYGKAKYGIYCTYAFVIFSQTGYDDAATWKQLYPNGDTMCINAGRTSFITMSLNEST